MEKVKALVTGVVIVGALLKVGVLLLAHSGGSETKLFEGSPPNLPRVLIAR